MQDTVEGRVRIKFTCKRIGTICELLTNKEKRKVYYDKARNLCDAMLAQEDHGLCPALPGGTGGNGAIKVKLKNVKYLLVSKSGKTPGEMDPLNTLCLVKTFDKTKWSCEYYSESDDIKPTSDTPMHWSILYLKGSVYKNNRLYPQMSLHGHALSTLEEASRLDLPYSRETLFSTPEDTKVMIEMVQQYTFPQHKVFVRLNHGYFLLGKSYEDCMETLMQKIVKHLL